MFAVVVVGAVVAAPLVVSVVVLVLVVRAVMAALVVLELPLRLPPLDEAPLDEAPRFPAIWYTKKIQKKEQYEEKYKANEEKSICAKGKEKGVGIYLT